MVITVNIGTGKRAHTHTYKCRHDLQLSVQLPRPQWPWPLQNWKIFIKGVCTLVSIHKMINPVHRYSISIQILENRNLQFSRHLPPSMVYTSGRECSLFKTKRFPELLMHEVNYNFIVGVRLGNHRGEIVLRFIHLNCFNQLNRFTILEIQ